MGCPSTVIVAQELSRELLRDLDERWAHTVGVARRAETLSGWLVPEDRRRELVVASAWLHDIGYSSLIDRRGFHPVDGAAFLGEEGWSTEITALVAHHSGARFVADVLGLTWEMNRYPFRESLETDLLTYADQTVGQGGAERTVETRAAEMLRRHGPDSASAQAHPIRWPYLLSVAHRVRRQLWSRSLPLVG